MTYLHASELGVHGKLRSSNCLIDGRFVVKISDFGLNILTTPSEVIQDASFYNSKHNILNAFSQKKEVSIDYYYYF